MEDVKVTLKLVGYRKMADLSQEEMANLLKISRTSYNKKEQKPELFSYAEKKLVETILSERVPDMPKIFF